MATSFLLWVLQTVGLSIPDCYHALGLLSRKGCSRRRIDERRSEICITCCKKHLCLASHPCQIQKHNISDRSWSAPDEIIRVIDSLAVSQVKTDAYKIGMHCIALAQILQCLKWKILTCSQCHMPMLVLPDMNVPRKDPAYAWLGYQAASTCQYAARRYQSNLPRHLS